MIDANTVVSAALSPGGMPRRAVAFARAHGAIALSESVYGKVADVLTRQQLPRVLDDDRRREILKLLNAAALWVEKETVQDRRDSNDNGYLELTPAAEATAMIAGDEELLVLHP